MASNFAMPLSPKPSACLENLITRRGTFQLWHNAVTSETQPLLAAAMTYALTRLRSPDPAIPSQA